MSGYRYERLIRLALLALTLACCMLGCMDGGSRTGGTPEPSASPAAALASAAPERLASDGPRTYRMVTAREFLSLRLRPDAASGRVKKLAPGALVEVLAEEGEFAYVLELATGYTGYALLSYLAPPPEGGVLPTPAPPGEPGLYRVTAEEYLTLRAAPSTSAEGLLTIEAGGVVEALSFQGNFAHVRVGETEGYVLAAYLVRAADASVPSPGWTAYEEEGDTAVVAAERYASLRALPDAASERRLKLPRGRRVAVLGHEGDFALVRDEATGEQGYVLSRLLVTEEEFAQVTPAEQPDIRYVDAMEYVTLRAAPSFSAEAIKTLKRGARVTALGREGDFAYVEDETGARGYALDGYLAGAPVAERVPETYTVFAGEYLSLRREPHQDAERLCKIPSGARVELLGLDGAYARVRYDGYEGYALSGYLKSEDDAVYGALSIVKPAEDYAPHMVGEALAALLKRYPDKLRVVSAGRSLQGRDIPVAMLGNPAAGRHILVQAAIHGREYMTASLALAQIEDMLARPAAMYGGATYRALLDAVCFHIFPMTNPDGVAISQARKASPALEGVYAADREAGLTDLALAEYLGGWKANAAGVDLNRNFDAGWRALGGPGAPSFSLYKGGAPGDQPEAAALIAYSMKYDFDATVSYHSSGSVIYWEYGGDAAVLEASRSLARAVRAVTRYPLAGAGGLDAGGYKDWAMEMRSIPSITIETGTRPCPLPQDEFDMIWRRNREVLPALALWAAEH